MIGDIAQIISIASYGNEFLNNGSVILDYKNHSSFHGVGDPVYNDSFSKEIGAIDGTNKWYTYLKELGCRKIRLFYYPTDSSKEYPSVLINESIIWVLESVFDNYSDYWSYSTFFTNGWQAKVEMTGHNNPIINKRDDLELIKRDLEKKLDNMIDFAKHIQWEKWAKNFCRIKDMLYLREPTLPEFHKDLIVSGNYSLLARQIFSAAVGAWCFTGMGSWSDNYAFKDDKKKEKVTRDFFLSICDAYVAVVNSF